jgi:hypothetical protein
LLSESVEKSSIENEIENLITLRRLCIAVCIGFILLVDSIVSRRPPDVRLHRKGYSSPEVISLNPAWWTAIMNAKVAAGIVIDVGCSGFGFTHNPLNLSKIAFDSDHWIQVAGSSSIRSELRESDCKETIEIASLLFHVVVGQPAHSDASMPVDVSDLISKLIETELWSQSERRA